MEDTNKGFSFKMGTSERFYKALNPNITTTKKGILYFNADTDDNAFPAKMQDLATNSSAVHSNMINLKSNLIQGEGLTPVVDEPTLQAFLDRVNKQGDNWNDMLEKWAVDMAVMEAICMQVLYDSEGNIAAVYHIDVSRVRAEKPNALGVVQNFYISGEWADISNKANRRASEKTRAIKIAAFDPNTWQGDGGVQLLYAKRYSMGAQFYAIPSYVSITPYCELQYELAKFHLNKVQKGFLSTGMLVLNGDPDEQTKNQFIRDFGKKYIGADKEKILYIWTTDEGQKPEWVKIEGDQDNGLFDTLNILSSESIAVGHGGSLSLIGVENKGVNFGDGGKLAVAVAFFNKNIIVPMQNVILSAVNKVLSVNELGEVEIPYVPLDEQISSDVNAEVEEEMVKEKTIIKELINSN